MSEQTLMDQLRAYGADMDGIGERFMNDEPFYAECFGRVIIDPHFEELKQAIRRYDYPCAFSAAHALKGLAANMGLTPLYEAVCVLVEALRTEQHRDLPVQCEAVFVQLYRLRSMI